ncbi:MAG: CRISPR-associated protein [Bacteroidales bacterium]|nr:CRISPR-associated protein [Bacteroidales bacterium]
MLINLSNHPSDNWGLKQTNASFEFNHVEDIPFPAIDPASSNEEIAEMAEDYFYLCLKMFEEYVLNVKQDEYNFAVHIQGEFTFVYALVNLLKKEGIRCVASTTKRIVEEKDGKKTVLFDFVQFREYK